MKAMIPYFSIAVGLVLWTTTAYGDGITNIRVSKLSPAYVGLNERLDVTFDYSTTEAGGVRIFARPFTGGVPTPNYAAHGSSLYAAGSGSGSGFFTITSGSVVVDQIRFQMLDDQQTKLLMEFFVDVEYHFGDHAIHSIVLSPTSIASLSHGDDVSLTFDYNTNESGGVRIFARPFSAGALTPNYAAHGSPLYASGSGSGSGSFTITNGDATVNQIRLQMFNSDQSRLLLEFFVDVEYVYTAHSIFNISVAPFSPASLPLSSSTDRVEVTFDYKTVEASGVRIFARPFTQGSLTPSYGASGSPLYPSGNGAGSGSFTITSGSPVVDGIRFQMLDANQSVILLEFVVPVHYLFAENRIGNLRYEPNGLSYVTNDELVSFTFDYDIVQAGGVRIFGRPFTDGSLSPDYAAHPSGLYTGSGNGNGFFTITAGDVDVDQIRYRISDSAGTVLAEYFVDVAYHFVTRPSGVATEPASPLPLSFVLHQNYPNPFNPTTTVTYDLPVAADVALTVYDVLGKRVEEIASGTRPAGTYEVSFDAAGLPSGVYFYRLEAGDYVETKRMVVVR